MTVVPEVLLLCLTSERVFVRRSNDDVTRLGGFPDYQKPAHSTANDNNAALLLLVSACCFLGCVRGRACVSVCVSVGLLFFSAVPWMLSM